MSDNNQPVPHSQLSSAIWRRSSSVDLVFRLVMFFNSLPTYNPKIEPIVEIRASERQIHCSPQLFKLMAVLKSADFRSRNIFSSEKSVQKAQEILKAEYLKIAHQWQRRSRQHSQS